MSHSGPTISTHVLDTGLGRPAMGVPVRLAVILDDGALKQVGSGITDVDGRVGLAHRSAGARQLPVDVRAPRVSARLLPRGHAGDRPWTTSRAPGTCRCWSRHSASAATAAADGHGRRPAVHRHARHGRMPATSRPPSVPCSRMHRRTCRCWPLRVRSGPGTGCSRRRRRSRCPPPRLSRWSCSRHIRASARHQAPSRRSRFGSRGTTGSNRTPSPRWGRSTMRTRRASASGTSSSWQVGRARPSWSSWSRHSTGTVTRNDDAVCGTWWPSPGPARLGLGMLEEDVTG